MSILDRKKKTTTKASEKSEKTVKKPAAKKKAAAAKEKKVFSLSKKVVNTLYSPVVSEKAAKLSDAGVLVFQVAIGANKVEVRNAFRELYKVTPTKVNFIKVRGAQMRFGKVSGKSKDYKKALITLPKGTRVDVFEGV